MTPDEIENALKSSAELPRAALAAGVGVAAELAPRILGRAERFCRGIYLLPEDLDVLVRGLHILAAARYPGLLPELLELMRQPEEDLERLFPMRVSTGLARLLLSVWDRPPDELLHMIEHADLGDDARDALYNVLARLAFDGRIARDETLAFLSRVERDDVHEDDAPAWWGWEDAVCRLGLTELEPALRRVWSKPGNEVFRPREHVEALADLRHAAANPTDAAEFDADDIRAITDPVEALEWIEEREAALAEWDEDDPAAEAEPDGDPAASIRLDDAETEWLSGFLASRQAPATAMSLEQLDGFVTALVIGPDTVLLAEYMPLAWGILDDNELVWEDQAQEEYVNGLLLRHAEAIKARRAAHAEHRPILEPYGDGEAWGMGFLLGIEMRADDWAPIFEDRRADQIVLPIVALSGTAPEEVYQEFDGLVREGILDELPVMLQMIAAYWQTPGRRLGYQEPVRSAKVGRNDPCPCGSGKKYKKCCGDSTRLH